MTVDPDSDDQLESMRWRVLGERTLYDNHWVRLVKVDVQPPHDERFEHHVVRLQRVACRVWGCVPDASFATDRPRKLVGPGPCQG